MTLVFDRRAALAGQVVTHALIVGVSEYVHLPASNAPSTAVTFGLKRLESPALSAAKVCAWLMTHADQLAKPLATCRLLISPSATELPLMPALPAIPGATAAPPQTADWAHMVTEAQAWRIDAGMQRDDTTVFFYSGHGLQKLGVPLLTLADFCAQNAGGRLMRSVELPNVVGGMAPSSDFPEIARTQIYFVDACREEVDQQALQTNAGSIFDVLSGYDDRATPIYQATYPGSVAQAKAGHPTDFCDALLEGLERGAENRDLSDPNQRWPVTVFTLHTALVNYFTGLNTGQYAPLGGVMKNAILRWLPAPPDVELSVVIAPDTAIDMTSVTLGGPAIRQQGPQRAQHPYKLVVPAGIYTLNAASQPPTYRSYEDEALVNQQNCRWAISMVRAP